MANGLRRRLDIRTLIAACGVVTALMAGLSVTSASADEGFRLSQTCAGCHGTNGAAPGSTIPVLGGQSPAYLADALRAYKSGERAYYVMKIFAAGYDDAQIDAIAGWFAAEPWVDSTAPFDATKVALGKVVADAKCAACHASSGKSTANGPRLAGQSAAYLALAAKAYKTGARSHGIASAALDAVSDSDIELAAQFYAAQR